MNVTLLMIYCENIMKLLRRSIELFYNIKVTVHMLFNLYA